MIRIAIYSRKSKFTGKGESIENQIELCRASAQIKYGKENCDFCIYEDEGFSGSNVERPEFQRLLIDLRAQKFDVFMCYRIDRVSRSVSDFAQFADELKRKDVEFMSLRESFDTSTIIGRAMMSISSVFAQMELETISERIRDNMTQLAKTGRWLGGSTPLGYRSIELSQNDDGKTRTLKMLEVVPEEAQLVKLIFDKYIKFGSLSGVQTYCLQNGITNPRTTSAYLRSGSIRNIIINPVYCSSSPAVHEFLTQNSYDLYSDLSEFDGKRGLMAYGKTEKDPHVSKRNDVSDWIVAVGLHEGIIPGEQWIKAQKLIFDNKDKTIRKPRNHNMLLSGLLTCGDCGSPMRPRTHYHGGKAYGTYYLCEVKDFSRSSACQMTNAPGAVDKLVLDTITEMSIADCAQSDYIAKRQIELRECFQDTEKALLERRLRMDELKKEIENLVDMICKYQAIDDAHVLLETMARKNAAYKAQSEALLVLEEQLSNSSSEAAAIESFQSTMRSAAKSLQNATTDEQRRILRTVINHIDWTGSELLIYFKFNPVAPTRIPFHTALSSSDSAVADMAQMRQPSN